MTFYAPLYGLPSRDKRGSESHPGEWQCAMWGQWQTQIRRSSVRPGNLERKCRTGPSGDCTETHPYTCGAPQILRQSRASERGGQRTKQINKTSRSARAMLNNAERLRSPAVYIDLRHIRMLRCNFAVPAALRCTLSKRSNVRTLSFEMRPQRLTRAKSRRT